MNDAARRLRAQKAYSTDPDYLERMAREEETRGVNPTKDTAVEGGSVVGGWRNMVAPSALAFVRELSRKPGDNQHQDD
jgi:hypothetical protein